MNEPSMTKKRAELEVAYFSGCLRAEALALAAQVSPEALAIAAKDADQLNDAVSRWGQEGYEDRQRLERLKGAATNAALALSRLTEDHLGPPPEEQTRLEEALAEFGVFPFGEDA